MGPSEPTLLRQYVSKENQKEGPLNKVGDVGFR